MASSQLFRSRAAWYCSSAFRFIANCIMLDIVAIAPGEIAQPLAGAVWAQDFKSGSLRPEGAYREYA